MRVYVSVFLNWIQFEELENGKCGRARIVFSSVFFLHSKLWTFVETPCTYIHRWLRERERAIFQPNTRCFYYYIHYTPLIYIHMYIYLYRAIVHCTVNTLNTMRVAALLCTSIFPPSHMNVMRLYVCAWTSNSEMRYSRAKIPLKYGVCVYTASALLRQSAVTCGWFYFWYWAVLLICMNVWLELFDVGNNEQNRAEWISSLRASQRNRNDKIEGYLWFLVPFCGRWLSKLCESRWNNSAVFFFSSSSFQIEYNLAHFPKRQPSTAHEKKPCSFFSCVEWVWATKIDWSRCGECIH